MRKVFEALFVLIMLAGICGAMFGGGAATGEMIRNGGKFYDRADIEQICRETIREEAESAT